MKEEFFVGDHVECARIPTTLMGRNRSYLKIHDFLGDEEDEDPDVQLVYMEFDGPKTIAYSHFRFAKLSELTEVGANRRIPAAQRQMLKMEAVQCGCHCGQETSGAEFRQGHDARFKGALQRWSNDRPPKDTPSDQWVRANMSPEEAKAKLVERNWPAGRPGGQQ